MKNTLLTTLATLVVSAAIAQCVPTTDFDGTGLDLSPNQLAPVLACVGCGDHEVEFSVQTFADTVLSVELAPGNPPLDVVVFADFFRLDSIGGLPDGLTYTTDAASDTTFDPVTNPFGYWINPGDTTSGFSSTTGCITISGPEAAWVNAQSGGTNNDGLYPLTVYIDARAANFDPAAIGGVTGFNVWLTEMGMLLDAFGDPNFTINGIRLQGLVLEVRESGVGVNEREVQLSSVSNYPNPFLENTTILFDLRTKVDKMNFEVFNILGASMHSEVLSPKIGKNEVRFNADVLSPGIYFYVLSDGLTTIIRKMSVK